MIERIKDFFEDRMIRSILKKSSADIFTKDIEFEYLENKYCKNKKGVDRLLIYCILEVASNREPITKEQKFNCVKHLYLENLELMLESKSIKSIVEIQGMEAEKQFLETKLERMSAKEIMEFDEYSFTSMQYKMELACKGAITPETYSFIKNQSEKITDINNKIIKITAEQNKN